MEEPITYETESVILEDLDDIKNVEYCKNIIFNPILPLEYRIECINRMFKLFGQSYTLDVINKMISMYIFSRTFLLKEFLQHVVIKSELPLHIKILCSNILYVGIIDQDDGFECLNYLVEFNQNDIDIANQFEMIFLLLNSNKFKSNAICYFKELIANQNIPNEKRYKFILELEKNKDYKDILNDMLYTFYQNTENDIRYRILSSQYILSNLNNKNEQLENELLVIAQNVQFDTNIRADIMDIIIHFGSNSNKIIANQLLSDLGHVNRINTIFNNSQNVHDSDIENSVLDILKYLIKYPTMKCYGTEITLKDIISDIHQYLESSIYDSEFKDKVKYALDRISIDRGLYLSLRITLENILIKLWSYIYVSKDKDEMLKRLIEELYDMSGLCSSGYYTRFSNVLSGFGKFSIKISFKTQVESNLYALINNEIKNITNIDNYDKYFPREMIEDDKRLLKLEELQNCLLDELTNKDKIFCENLNRFIRVNIVNFKDILYGDFKDYLNDPEFEQFFRSSVSKYLSS